MSPVDLVALHGLHWVARAALRVQSPLRARSTVSRIARSLRSLRGIDEARCAARELKGSGSCLSRALTVAARLPGAEVVIGVDRWRFAGSGMHAWIEAEGVVVEDGETSDANYGVIARLHVRHRSSDPLTCRVSVERTGS